MEVYWAPDNIFGGRNRARRDAAFPEDYDTSESSSSEEEDEDGRGGADPHGKTHRKRVGNA